MRLKLDFYKPGESPSIGLVCYANQTRLVFALHFWIRTFSIRLIWSEREWWEQ